MNTLSTIIRDRNNVKVFMCANTVSRFCFEKVYISCSFMQRMFFFRILLHLFMQIFLQFVIFRVTVFQCNLKNSTFVRYFGFQKREGGINRRRGCISRHILFFFPDILVDFYFLVFRSFQRCFTEFFHCFFDFQRSLTSTSSCCFVTVFNLSVSIF